MVGKSGTDLIVRVPLGTIVRREENGAGGDVVVDIVRDGQRAVVAKGGRGGHGNTRFTTSTNQAPRRAENGEQGEEHWLLLDLKLIADVGITGYPNAGKSTLLSAVTRATPKIADYPFTTLEPVLGVVELGYRNFVLADVPGIIEGAHRGLGLGHDFLRHIERTKVIIHLVDGGAEDPLADLKKVENELLLHNSAMGNKPRIVAVNKIDITGVKERIPSLRRTFKELKDPVYFISAATGEGVNELMKKALEMLDKAGAASGEKERQEEFHVFRPKPLNPKPRSRRGERHD